MGGLDNLAELKVLNLAGNQIRKISNMQGLISLEELNIRRNRIRSTTGLVSTTLEKLFISNNELQVYLIRGATGKARARPCQITAGANIVFESRRRCDGLVFQNLAFSG